MNDILLLIAVHRLNGSASFTQADIAAASNYEMRRKDLPNGDVKLTVKERAKKKINALVTEDELQTIYALRDGRATVFVTPPKAHVLTGWSVEPQVNGQWAVFEGGGFRRMFPNYSDAISFVDLAMGDDPLATLRVLKEK